MRLINKSSRFEAFDSQKYQRLRKRFEVARHERYARSEIEDGCRGNRDDNRRYANSVGGGHVGYTNASNVEAIVSLRSTDLAHFDDPCSRAPLFVSFALMLLYRVTIRTRARREIPSRHPFFFIVNVRVPLSQ